MYRVGELIVDTDATDLVAQLVGQPGLEGTTIDGSSLTLLTGIPGELGVAAAVRARGFRAQPNHVVFAAAGVHA
ncbi:MAG TPA: hypothetical protein PLN29_02500, partial [Ilumatobacteraceae bacterium]|nr:hypothetical protein [Ilumatobacteraceae bacterium]